MKPLGREPLPEFDEALDAARRSKKAPQPKCDGQPMVYVDYTTPPSAEIARELCAGAGPKDPARCKLYDLCRASALAERPDWGVRGGIVWVNGRQYHLRRTATHDVDELEDEAA